MVAFISIGLDNKTNNFHNTTQDLIKNLNNIVGIKVDDSKLDPSEFSQLIINLCNNKTVTHIDFGGYEHINQISKYLNNLLSNNKSLQSLHLWFCNADDEPVIEIINPLKTNQTLKELFLGVNNLTDKAAAEIAEVLKVNSSLQKLTLNLNKKITELGFKALRDALIYNYSLIELGTDDNKYSNAITDILKTDKTLRKHIAIILKDEPTKESLSWILNTENHAKIIEYFKLFDKSEIDAKNFIDSSMVKLQELENKSKLPDAPKEAPKQSNTKQDNSLKYTLAGIATFILAGAIITAAILLPISTLVMSLIIGITALAFVAAEAFIIKKMYDESKQTNTNTKAQNSKLLKPEEKTAQKENVHEESKREKINKNKTKANGKSV